MKDFFERGLIAILTYQDFQKAGDRISFLHKAITDYRASEQYLTAITAHEYYAQRNTTILETVRYIYSQTGLKSPDFTAANNKLASNFFRRLVKQRVTYSLGNGIIWANDPVGTKERVGRKFDEFVYHTAKEAIIGGVAYGYWNRDAGHTFSATEFVPLVDETDGTLRAGIRFWCLEWGKRPITAVLYEEDGYAEYQTKGADGAFMESKPKRGYLEIVQSSEADGEKVVGELNYGTLPIIPMYANDVKQSALVGMRALIDAYDVIQSGFANSIEDCAEFYMLVGGAMGMEQADLEKFRDQLKFLHIGVVDTDNSSITPYTQEVPYAARDVCMKQLRNNIYEFFGALDVGGISAAAKTATEIQAAYQPMDEEADDFEYQIISFVHGVLNLMGIEDDPTFKRNRVCNQPEQTQMVLSAADYLDRRTLMGLLPFIDSSQIDDILEAKEREKQEEQQQQAAQQMAQQAMSAAIEQPPEEPEQTNQ